MPCVNEMLLTLSKLDMNLAMHKFEKYSPVLS